MSQTVVNAVLDAKPIYQSESINASCANAVLNRNTIGISNTESVSEVKSRQTPDTSVITKILASLDKEITHVILEDEVSGTHSASALSIVGDTI